MLALKPSVRSVSRPAIVPRAQPFKAVSQAVQKVQQAPLAKPALTAIVANLVMATPAHAGKLFDFDATLPVMIVQFLLLMVFMDKTWFGPTGRVLDERDELIRSKLARVQGNTSEISELQEEAEKVLRESRAAANAEINEAKRSTQAEQDAKIEALKEQLDKELEKALEDLENEHTSAKSSINEQVDALADEILGRVLPEGSMPKEEPAGAN